MREMNARGVIICLVDGTLIQGMTNIGNSRRLSDFFKKDDGMFMTLFDAQLGDGTQTDVYFVNRNHILWAKPDGKDDAAELEDISLHSSTAPPTFK